VRPSSPSVANVSTDGAANMSTNPSAAAAARAKAFEETYKAEEMPKRLVRAAVSAAQAVQDASTHLMAGANRIVGLLQDMAPSMPPPASSVATGKQGAATKHPTTLMPASFNEPLKCDIPSRGRTTASGVLYVPSRSRSRTSSSREPSRFGRCPTPRWDVSASEMAGASSKPVARFSSVAAGPDRRLTSLQRCEAAQAQGRAARTKLGEAAESAAAAAASSDTARSHPQEDSQSRDDIQMASSTERPGGGLALALHQSTPPPRAVSSGMPSSRGSIAMLPVAPGTPLSPEQLAHVEMVWQSALNDTQDSSCAADAGDRKTCSPADTPRLLQELNGDIRKRIVRSRHPRDPALEKFSRADLEDFVNLWRPQSPKKELLKAGETVRRAQPRLRISSMRARVSALK